MTEGNENGESQKDANGAKGQGVSLTAGFRAGFGFDPSAAGAFPGMPFGGDFNHMQMMMAMQNGMGASGFGNFPMTGMFLSTIVVNYIMLIQNKECLE
jgi:hypothetical protein